MSGVGVFIQWSLALGTSGITYNPNNHSYLKKLDRLMKVTDLVMLDIKHIDEEEHIWLTKHSNKHILEFAHYLDQKNIPLWVRHVVVPTITYAHGYLYKLGLFLGTLSNLKALDVLAYHDMGITKYKELGIDYPLKDLPPLEKSEALKAKEYILQGILAQQEKQGHEQEKINN